MRFHIQPLLIATLVAVCLLGTVAAYPAGADAIGGTTTAENYTPKPNSKGHNVAFKAAEHDPKRLYMTGYKAPHPVEDRKPMHQNSIKRQASNALNKIKNIIEKK
ncbi:hypothetical protein IWQ60_004716 [Tieghemiomyces parasiticus]|uniref:Uncharacterized protein n=1 Tax=Tieghemiomyces parasiticus TaxID=78921 RepID=A0A9W8DYX3_9FUNG|nr:hypothetical protein IWQ60_004716 [Tieghemiomyces parasiticus]